MPKSIAEKLRIKPADRLLAINAPDSFKKGLQGLPAGVKISNNSKDYNQVHWFVFNKKQLEKELAKLLKLLKPGVIIWAYYPKATSKIQTDLSRDKGWENLLAKGDQLTWISLISFDATWSVFGFRHQTDTDKKKQAKPQQREIFNWVNPATKEVRLPKDLAAALKKHSKAAVYFESLSFTNKKEYIEWVVTAKREETRNERVKGSIERLEKQWKNPRNT